MKTKILLLVTIISLKGFSQDTIKIINTHSQIFSLSPISKKVDKVNGLVIGVGHFEEINLQKQTVNGINIEISPLIFALPYFAIYRFGTGFKKIDEDIKFQSAVENKIKINGFNASTGGFMDGADVNGVNISTFTFINDLNGVSISPGITNIYKLNGLSFAFNNTIRFQNGISVGVINECQVLKGLQIGLYNRSYKSQKGFQLGIWNKNSKRSFPLINW